MTNSVSPLPVTSIDIDAAARVLAPFAIRTPLLSSPALDERVGAKVLLKPEMLQRTGSFKFRGAFNKLSSIPQDARGGGVVAFSSGNHAQGVAAAAQILKMQATIVMPKDAPKSKRERTKGFGAEVVLYDRDREDREAIARAIADKRGATLVPPYDDPLVIAGQGTLVLEALEQVPDTEVLVLPVGGGGLLAGSAAAAERTARKELQRLERQLDRLTAREAGLSAELAANATDYEKLTALGAELKAAQAEKADLEERWLTVAAARPRCS